MTVYTVNRVRCTHLRVFSSVLSYVHTECEYVMWMSYECVYVWCRAGDPERGECGGGEGVRGHDLPGSSQRGHQEEAINSGNQLSQLSMPSHYSLVTHYTVVYSIYRGNT